MRNLLQSPGKGLDGCPLSSTFFSPKQFCFITAQETENGCWQEEALLAETPSWRWWGTDIRLLSNSCTSPAGRGLFLVTSAFRGTAIHIRFRQKPFCHQAASLPGTCVAAGGQTTMPHSTSWRDNVHPNNRDRAVIEPLFRNMRGLPRHGDTLHLAG